MNKVSSLESGIWRMAGGDPARRGFFPDAIRVRAREMARLPASGAVQAAAVFDAAGRVYVADLAGGVQAFTGTGDRRWRVTVGAGISATPALNPTDTLIYLGNHAGSVFALETETGAVRWRRDIPSRRDPRVLSDFLYLAGPELVVFSSWAGRWYGLDSGTGETRLEWEAGIYPRSAASADREGNVYAMRAVGGRGTEVVRTRVGGGETVIHREPEDSRGAGRALVASPPVLDEERGVAYAVFNREKAGRLLAWSLGTGERLWARELPASVQGVPAVMGEDGLVVMTDLAGEVHGLGPDGAPRFRVSLSCDYLLAGVVGAARGWCWVGDPLGRVHELDAGGGRRTVVSLPRSVSGRLAFDPTGNLYAPCTDHAVYRLAAVERRA